MSVRRLHCVRWKTSDGKEHTERAAAELHEKCLVLTSLVEDFIQDDSAQLALVHALATSPRIIITFPRDRSPS